MSLFNLNEFTGSIGEQLTKYYSKFMADAYVLHDVLIDGIDGMTSQIDLILVGSKGIYVVEVKNYSDAYIYGDGKKNKWYYYLGKNKYEIYSPLMQNKKHIKYLKEFLKDFGELPFFSIVLIICKDIKVGNINENSSELTTVVCSSLLAMKRGIKLLTQNREQVINDEEKKQIYDFIIDNQHKGKLARLIHKENVIEQNRKREELISKNVCPYCKAELILRKGKYGEFYGCSNYPKCRFTKKL